MNLYISARATIFIYKVTLSDTMQKRYDFSKTCAINMLVKHYIIFTILKISNGKS
jgi:hypothetical protein